MDPDAQGKDGTFASQETCGILRSSSSRFIYPPKPEAMGRITMDRPLVAPAIASGFGLNEEFTTVKWRIAS